MIPSDYTASRAFIVDLAERYAIEGRLLGKHLQMRPSENYVLEVVFPALVNKCQFVELGMPGLFDKYGIDEDNWGKVNSYTAIDNFAKADVWISSVLVVCHSNEICKLPSSSLIQNQSKRVLHNIQVINPDSIRMSSDNQKNVLCRIEAAVSYEVGKRPQAEISFESLIDDREGQLSFSDIKQGIQKINDEVSLPYEMLDNARISLFRHDRRATILNCATAIEIMLKQKIDTYLETISVPCHLKQHVLKQADGFVKLKNCCKDLSIALTGLPNVQKFVVDIRNRVIHGGADPSCEEANKAYEITRSALKALRVPLFKL